MGLADPDDRIIKNQTFHLPDQDLTLGVLRNFALDHVLGDYICQWDDDDLYDPVRLALQWQSLSLTDAQAFVLARWMIWWPQLQKLLISSCRDWEGSLLCERSLMPRYPDVMQGEDSVVLEQLRQSICLVRIDMPRLCEYVALGANAFQPDHFKFYCQESIIRWLGVVYLRLEEKLERRLPLLSYCEILAIIADSVIIAKNQQLKTEIPVRPKDPRVLILTFVRDPACYSNDMSCSRST